MAPAGDGPGAADLKGTEAKFITLDQLKANPDRLTRVPQTFSEWNDSLVASSQTKRGGKGGDVTTCQVQAGATGALSGALFGAALGQFLCAGAGGTVAFVTAGAGGVAVYFGCSQAVVFMGAGSGGILAYKGSGVTVCSQKEEQALSAALNDGSARISTTLVDLDENIVVTAENNLKITSGNVAMAISNDPPTEETLEVENELETLRNADAPPANHEENLAEVLTAFNECLDQNPIGNNQPLSPRRQIRDGINGLRTHQQRNLIGPGSVPDTTSQFDLLVTMLWNFGKRDSNDPDPCLDLLLESDSFGYWFRNITGTVLNQTVYFQFGSTMLKNFATSINRAPGYFQEWAKVVLKGIELVSRGIR